MSILVPVARTAAAEQPTIRLSEVISALSYALDITEGQPEGHAARSCMIGMRLASIIGLPQPLRSPLFYGLLLKDLGCSSNAAKVYALMGADDLIAKRNLKIVDWARLPQAAWYGLSNLAPHASFRTRAAQFAKVALNGGPFAAKQLFAVRCDRGADIAAMLGFPAETSAAIRALDEHWNGGGYPHGLKGETIPLLARIMCIAQTVDIFFRLYGLEGAYDVINRRRGSWFDPMLVDAMQPLKHVAAFWQQLGEDNVWKQAAQLEPEDHVFRADDAVLDRIAQAFGQIIDAKSPWMFAHSEQVAALAEHMGRELGFSPAVRQHLRRAALLHDIGKLGISNHILEKPTELNRTEQRTLQQHPTFTRRMLERVPAFAPLADIASANHERLDGSGYDRGLRLAELSLPARVIAVADAYGSMTADTPARASIPPEQALRALAAEAGRRVCAESVGALDAVIHMVPPARAARAA